MTMIVCDTDFLMKVTNEPIPKLRQMLQSSEYELVAIPSVLRELKGLASSSNQKTARYARNALRAVEDKLVLSKVGASPAPKTEADIAILDFALNQVESVVVATLDGTLFSELESRRVSYLTLRNDRPFTREFDRATYLTTKKRRS